MFTKPLSPAERASGLVLRWPTPQSRDWTTAFLESAGRNPNILAVVAIGSAVRPRVPTADIDLLVICKDPHVLNEVPPLEVDLRAYSGADIHTQLAGGHDLLGWAVRFGRVLFQRGCFWDGIVDSWRHRLPLPSSEVARARAARAFRHFTNVFRLGDTDAAREQALSYLTQLARAELLDRGVYPASRPELAEQLRGIGNAPLAEWMDRLVYDESTEMSQLEGLVKLAL